MKEKAVNYTVCLHVSFKKPSNLVFKYFIHNYAHEAQRHIRPRSSDNTCRWITMLHVCVTSFNYLSKVEEPFCCTSDCWDHDQKTLWGVSSGRNLYNEQLPTTSPTAGFTCWKTAGWNFGHLNTVTVWVEREVFAAATYDCFWQARMAVCVILKKFVWL